ncbi:hypothetical protein HNO88_000719 [Novosphingobium chloroacetimidivorans]|uniref:Outer membrane beta-barrel protein n=1 Tax=Novosphingobium chloroacetimidivorans TaxID=1428314 RepID=A0A7W7K736_9SPHN|nr:outer membrane beta-barrel protein [Novosphingobium chloroacetimidivorans]MBB4857412.1 hypothetical protein [Novosphingobium chloroacetimidivorans]
MALFAGHAARAQDVSASPSAGTQFDRLRTVSVADRVQPGYEEVGTRTSGFVFYPRVRAQVTYDDNVRAGTSDKDDDVAFTIEPSVRAVSEWSRHQLGLLASANLTRFARLDTENAETYSVQGQGRYDAGDEVRFYGDVGYRRDVERRSAPGALRNSRKPVSYRTASAGGQATWQGNRLRLTATARAAKISYEDVDLGDGVTIDSRELDRSRYQAGLRADYAVTADLAVLVSGTLSKLDYNRSANPLIPDRTARRAELLAGVSFEFTDLLRGEVAVGYIHQNFRSAGIRNFSGFGGRAEVEYFPTRLTTVRLDASRTLQEAGNPLAPSYRRTHFGLRVDHELYRYIVVSGFADYESDRFQLPERTERRRHFGASAQYLVDRHITLFTRYDNLHVTSRPAAFGRRLTDNAISVGVLIKL